MMREFEEGVTLSNPCDETKAPAQVWHHRYQQRHSPQVWHETCSAYDR
jgi:hypothetical protein